MYNSPTSLHKIWLPPVRSRLTRLTFYLTFIFTIVQANGQIMYHSLPQAPQLANNPMIQAPQAQPTLRPSLYPPLLKVKTQEGYLFENAEIGTTVRILPDLRSDALQILVEDPDLKPGMSPAIYQYVLHGYGAEKFAVDQRGYLYLNTPGGLDADSNSSTYQLHVEAREVDTEPMRRSEPISLTIHILDINDNSPEFEQPFYVANVSAVGSERFVARLIANDLDSGKFGKLTYRIVDVSDGAISQFRYDISTRTLVVMGNLMPNRRYQVTIEAVDGGGLIGRTVIFVNSLPPTTASSSITRHMEAYSSRNNPEPVSQPLLPIAKLPSTTMPKTAPPLGISNQVQTILTELSEATPQNSIVAVLGDESTKSSIYFRIVDGNEQKNFSIDKTTGTVTTVKEFDREHTDLYTLQIEARSLAPDQSLYWTLLQVAITDVNDNSPEFEGDHPLYIHLSVDDIESFKPNMDIGRVKAKDADKGENGRVSYRFKDQQRLFKINKSNGLIAVDGDFTTEHFGEHQFTVIASDHGKPPLETTVKLIIRIDGSFYTQAQTTTIPTTTGSSSSSDYYEIEETVEESSIAPLLFSRATLPPHYTNDPSSGQQVASGSQESNSGSIESTSETTTLALPQTTNQPLEIPNKPTFHTHSTSTLAPTPPPRLAPIFPSLQTSIMVDENDGDLELATLEAHYPDDQPGPITYLMKSGDSNLFSVSSYTGKLILLKPLDAEKEREFTIIVGTAEANQLATSPNLSHTATITVKVLDVNDWIPNFETNDYVFTINDKIEPGTIIGQVTAYDQDRDAPNNRIHYRVTSTDGTEKIFSVNAESGLITINREVKEMAGKKLMLRVEASDEGDPPQATQTMATVIVEASELQVIPKNEKPRRPVPGTIQFAQRNYTASLLENVRPPYLVQSLSVISKPKDTRFIMCAIVSGNYKQAFTISPTSNGDCELRTQNSLDRESIERYLLNVTVTSEAQTDFALVYVTVLDFNDNAPKFIFPNDLPKTGYFAGISSEAEAFTRVLTVKAEDADLGQSGQVQYELDTLSGDAKYFAIDKESGELSLKQSMIQLTQSNKRNNFELKIVACDSPATGQKLCSKADVFINAVSDQHRFMTMIKGAQPQQIRAHEQDLIRALRQFTGSCTLVTMEGMRERQPSMTSDPSLEVFWHAQNPTSHQICRKQEYRKLFDKSSLELLSGKLKPWFTLSNMVDNVNTSPSASSSSIGPTKFLTNLEWNNTTLMCAGVAVGVAVLALFVTCTVCLYWQRKKHRRSNVHTYPNIYPLPKYSSALYMPNGTLERDKIYETQMLELPMSDEDFATLKQSTIRSSEARLNTNAYRFQPHQPPYRQMANRPFHAGAFSYAHQNDGDFSVDENLYAVNTPSRLDPITRRLHPILPNPDYPIFSNQKKSLL